MISIIIPNYNGIDNLKKNLTVVIEMALRRKDCEIIVVDDASTDESIKFLQDMENTYQDKLKIQIIAKKVNTGFSSTVNLGVSKGTGDRLLLLNTDVIPQDNFIDKLEKNMNQNVFAVGALNKTIDNGEEKLEGRGIGDWKRGFLIHQGGEMNKKTTLWVSGGAGLFDRSIWDKLGGLDEIYDPFYWEDIDLCYRALRAGYELVFEKEAVVVHEHSRGSIRQRFSPFKIKTVAYRNQFIFVWKNSSPKLFLSNILWLPYHLGRSVVSMDPAFWLGFLSAMTLLPQILAKRLSTKALYKKSDKEVTITL